MTNIVKTNNPNLRLAAMSVGVLSTLRVSLPLVPADATNVEIIVTAGTTHNAYAAAYDSTDDVWNCDIAASQFPETGKQKYEVAYKLGGKQFWDGAGWITIDAATTSGLTPVPQPQPARYVVTTINGYGAPDSDGAVRIPKVNIGTEDPSATTGYIEGDQYFNRTSGAQWVLCSVTGTLTWVKCAGGGAEGDFVSKTGDTMTGALTTPSVKMPLNSSVTVEYQPTGVRMMSGSAEQAKITFPQQSGVFALKSWVENAAGYKTEYNGTNITDNLSVRSLSVQRYYNIQSACRFSLPKTSEIPEGGGRWLFHLADNIQASQVVFLDFQNRTIVTNNSTTAYAGSITGDKIGLSHAWKMVTIRIFKNPQGAEIVYLEV